MAVWVEGSMVKMECLAKAGNRVTIVEMWYTETATDRTGMELQKVVDSESALSRGPLARVEFVDWHYTSLLPAGGYTPPVKVTVIGYAKFRADNGTEETLAAGPLTVQIDQ